MKTISTTLKAHMQQSVTSMCTCWKIVRTDGTTLGFTDHDSDLVFGGVTYVAHTGYTRTAVVSDNKFTVDNMEVEGILDSDFIAEHDLRNGVYNYAQVTVFGLNWKDLTQGAINYRKGWFGEITISPNGSFKTELRGLTQALANNFGAVISPTCRADLGDSKCKIPIEPPVWTPITAYATGTWLKVNLGDALPEDPYHGVIWRATTGGTSGTDSSVFGGIGSTSTGPVTDGTVTWMPYNAFTKQGVISGVASRKAFLVSGLTVPASGLFGPNTDSLGNTQQVLNANIYTGANPGYATHAPSRNITVAITSTNGNVIHLNPFIAAGSGPVAITGSGTTSISLVGPLESVQSTLSQGLFWTNTTTLTGVIGITAADAFGTTSSMLIGMPQNESYYAGATIYFVSGQNAGKAMEVYAYANSTIVLWLSLPFQPTVGDVFRIYPGCDHTRATCLRFGNVINFRGEPDLPGQDFLYAPNLSF